MIDMHNHCSNIKIDHIVQLNNEENCQVNCEENCQWWKTK